MNLFQEFSIFSSFPNCRPNGLKRSHEILSLFDLKICFVFFIVSFFTIASDPMVQAKTENANDLLQMIKTDVHYSVKPEFEEAANLQKSKKYKEASSIYKKLLKEDLNNSLAWNNLGLCQQDLKIYDLAEKCYRRAIQISPADAQFYNNLGSLKVETGDFDEAEKSFLEAIKKDLDYPFSYSNLAGLYQQKGKLYKAVENYKKAIDAAPLAEFYYRLGLLYFQMKKFDDMSETFQQALRLQPDYSEVYYSLSMANLYNLMGYGKEKRRQQLMVYLKKLAEVDPKLAKDFQDNYLVQINQKKKVIK